MRKRLAKKERRKEQQRYVDASMALADTCIRLMKARQERREKLRDRFRG